MSAPAPAASRAPARAHALRWFDRLSWLQYPFMLVALGFVLHSAWTFASRGPSAWTPILEDWNLALLLAGVGVGLSSLQDPTRTQNDLSRKVWQDPRKGRLMLWVLGVETFGPIVLGLAGIFVAGSEALRAVSLGLVCFGLGMLGLLKTALEMFEHHRLDRARHASGRADHPGGEGDE